MARERLELIRGDSADLIVTVTDEDGAPWAPVGTPQVYCTAKHRLTDTDDDAVFAKTIGDGITRVGNVVTVTIAPADTATLLGSQSVSLYGDVQVKDDETTRTPYQFLLVVAPDVTRTP